MNTDSEAGAAEYTGALWLNIKFVPSDSDLSDRDLLDKIITSIQSRQLTISCHSLAAYASLFFSIKINGPFHGVDDIYKEASSNVEAWLQTVDLMGLPFSRWEIFKL
ncbi:hypothetical protein N7509_003337 [Penicillium cosmopolitanum]|uniref:Uncharacterized protein n=1 Tax=Penicillium cosmopolitanum TaxID=1131564 RepID=A0A9X0BB94_9EURO|nr:uncharacterized protein N7509_003337 [Penicillium cosmopolitanum]KAJ5403466.1 hypothetical protein N7509_003337 [Penicillium cosmopolitanum]